MFLVMKSYYSFAHFEYRRFSSVFKAFLIFYRTLLILDIFYEQFPNVVYLTIKAATVISIPLLNSTPSKIFVISCLTCSLRHPSRALSASLKTIAKVVAIVH